MKRAQLRKYFRTTGPVILPVIHVLDFTQVERNVRIARQSGAPGVFLINHDFGVDEFLPIICQVREAYPDFWLGVNFLGVPIDRALPHLSQLQSDGVEVDGYWGDDGCIDERDPDNQPQAEGMAAALEDGDWNGVYFGGVAFKKQRPVKPGHFAQAAKIASHFMDVVTTSGKSTGSAASLDKVSEFRRGIGDGALALASGVTPQNFIQYKPLVDAVLVATGINKKDDFYNIDAELLKDLIHQSRQDDSNIQSTPRDPGWYFDLMAPRSRSEKYAWLDPSSAYINAESFNAIIDRLLEPFNASEIDVVAGIDAAGFVLAGAMAARINKGVLTLRKGGKVPVDYDVVPMLNYSQQTQELEMRKPAFAPGTRVLLVDQWMETGGTMSAAVRLVERQQGKVAGIAVICAESNDFTKDFLNEYQFSTCVEPGSHLQEQCDRQYLDSFSSFDPRNYFPTQN